MRLELKEFVQATRNIHQRPGGVKRMRLMLRLRPHQSRKSFVLKATDGRVTMTTRVENYGQLKLIESLVNEFVMECTKAAVGSPAPQTVSAGAGEQQTSSAASASPASTALGNNSRNLGAAATKATQQAGTGGSATHEEQTQVSASSQINNNSSSGDVGGRRRQNRGQKGKRH